MVMKDEIFTIINEEISDLEKERRRMVEGELDYCYLCEQITALENILQRIDRMDERQMELFS